MTDAAVDETSNAPAVRPVSKAYQRYALGLLLAIYTLNFLDRQVVNILAEKIKLDLHLSDTQLGMMTGFAFAIFYTAFALPIARLADRANRPWIIAAAVAVWSVFTLLCGFAGNFAQLFLARVGVGIGEAGCSPPSHSLISDYVPANKRASAIAFYSLGTPLGSLLGAAMGGVVADIYGWRAAFMVAGAPGIAVALLAAFTLVEPRPKITSERRAFGEMLAALIRSELTRWILTAVLAGALAANLSIGLVVTTSLIVLAAGLVRLAVLIGRLWRQEDQSWAAIDLPRQPTTLEALAEIFRKRTFWLIALGGAVMAFCGYAQVAFAPSFFFRNHAAELIALAKPLGLKPTGFVGLVLGTIGGIAGLFGTFIGGQLADWLGAKDRRWHVTMPAIAAAVGVPFFLAAMFAPSTMVAVLFFMGPNLTNTMWYGPIYGTTQSLVRPRTRAIAAAVILFIINIIGLGGGPVAMGALSDLLAKGYHLGAAEGLRWAMVASEGVILLASAFFLMARKTIREDVVS